MPMSPLWRPSRILMPLTLCIAILLTSCSAPGTASTSPQTTSTPQAIYQGIYRGHSNGVSAIAWSPDGKRIASASYDKTVQVWDAATGHLFFTYRGHANWVIAVAWSPDGKRIASASFDRTVQVWDATTGKHLLTYRGHSGTVTAVAWSPDGHLLASASYDKTVQICDV